MSDDKQDDSVEQALRQTLRGGRARPEETAPLEARQAMEIAAYLDGTMDDAATRAFEESLLHDGASLELVIASRDGLGRVAVTLPSAVVARASGLLAAPTAAPRREALAGLRDRLSSWFTGPWRPALGALAFGLYALFCVQVFDMGQKEGENLAAAPGLALAGGGFTLALDDIL